MADKPNKLSFKEAYKMAKDAGVKFPRAVAAQFGLEMNWSTDSIGKNNVFNIHWDDRSAEKMRDKNIKVTKSAEKHKDGSGDFYFMEFESLEDGFKAYERFIQTNKRYREAGALDAKTDEEYIKAVSKAGYAEDPNYLKKWLNIAGQDVAASNEAKEDFAKDNPRLKEAKQQIADAKEDRIKIDGLKKEMNASRLKRLESEQALKQAEQKLKKIQSETFWSPNGSSRDRRERKAKEEISKVQADIKRHTYNGKAFEKSIDVAMPGGITPESREENWTSILKDLQGKETEYIDSRSQEILDDLAVKDEVTNTDGLSEEEQKALTDFNTELTELEQGVGEDTFEKEQYVYNKDDFDQSVGKKIKDSLPSIMQGALAIAGIAGSNVKLPRYEDEVDASVYAYLQESKRISEQGLPIAKMAEAQKNLNSMYKAGMDNLVRASGGNRNAVLANAGQLDVMRAKGMTNLTIADEQAKQKAFADYGKTLEYIDKFKRDKKQMNYKLDLAEAQQARTEGTQLANSALSNLMKEIEFQKKTAPGSPAHMLQAQIMNRMGMPVPGIKAGMPGSKEQLDAQAKERQEFVANSNAAKQEKRDNIKAVSTMSREQRIAVKNSGKSIQDLIDNDVLPVEQIDTVTKEMDAYKNQIGMNASDMTPLTSQKKNYPFPNMNPNAPLETIPRPIMNDQNFMALDLDQIVQNNSRPLF